MRIPNLDIGGLIAAIPFIQGAMGVGVSGACLASAVANEGGVGILAGVDIGYREPDFIKNTLKANIRALTNEIKKARLLSPKGIIGINLMVAMNHYNEMVHAAVSEGIDLIVSGAGLPLNLPELVKGFHTKIVPIVSSNKAVKTLLKYWDNHYGTTSDMVIVEGPEAGGHLGFSEETLNAENKPSLIDIVKEVINDVNPFQDKFNKKIPVIAAGGIFTGGDIAECLKAGASGVQMATRFVATNECDADIKFKQAYVNSKKEDIHIIKSPVGMPGRALNNKFLKKIAEYGDEIKGCFQCIKGCNPKIAPYCISTALINAVKGNVDEGLIFVGSNAYRINNIISVKELIDRLKSETELFEDR